MLIRLICLAGAGLAATAGVDPAAAPPPGLPALTSYQAPTFPEDLRLTSIADGYVVMMFTIDKTGIVDDALALEASHPAFVSEIGNVLSKWRFEPADSPTTPRREVIQFDFRRTGMVASMSHRDAASAVFVNTTTPAPAVRTVEWEQLEKTPARKVGVMPARVDDTRSGSAAVSFIIDQSGRVRVPTLVAASDPRFGQEVLKAIHQWQFEAPMQDGAAVNVRATRSFSFGGAKQTSP